jgi:hypothetical protein
VVLDRHHARLCVAAAASGAIRAKLDLDLFYEGPRVGGAEADSAVTIYKANKAVRLVTIDLALTVAGQAEMTLLTGALAPRPSLHLEDIARRFIVEGSTVTLRGGQLPALAGPLIDGATRTALDSVSLRELQTRVKIEKDAIRIEGLRVDLGIVGGSGSFALERGTLRLDSRLLVKAELPGARPSLDVRLPRDAWLAVGADSPFSVRFRSGTRFRVGLHAGDPTIRIDHPEEASPAKVFVPGWFDQTKPFEHDPEERFVFELIGHDDAADSARQELPAVCRLSPNGADLHARLRPKVIVFGATLRDGATFDERVVGEPAHVEAAGREHVEHCGVHARRSAARADRDRGLRAVPRRGSGRRGAPGLDPGPRHHAGRRAAEARPEIRTRGVRGELPHPRRAARRRAQGTAPELARWRDPRWSPPWPAHVPQGKPFISRSTGYGLYAPRPGDRTAWGFSLTATTSDGVVHASPEIAFGLRTPRAFDDQERVLVTAEISPDPVPRFDEMRTVRIAWTRLHPDATSLTADQHAALALHVPGVAQRSQVTPRRSRPSGRRPRWRSGWSSRPARGSSSRSRSIPRPPPPLPNTPPKVYGKVEHPAVANSQIEATHHIPIESETPATWTTSVVRLRFHPTETQQKWLVSWRASRPARMAPRRSRSRTSRAAGR